MKFIEVDKAYTPEVALEGILGLDDKSFANVVNSIANYFPDLSNMLAGPIGVLSHLKEIPSSVQNALTTVFAAGSMSVNDFTAYNKVKINTPESFSGNLSEYADYVERSWIFLQHHAIPKIDVFYGYLASFASNKEVKISLVDTTKIYKALETEHYSLKKEGSTYFGQVRHNASSSTLGSCFTDFDQFVATQTIVKKLAKELNPKQATQVCDRIKKISSVLDIIISDAKARNYDKASFEAVKSLAVGIYALAEVLEFYSVTYYRGAELATVMASNKDVINKLK